MKNIHVLPTDKPSRLVKFFTKRFHLCKEILPIQDEEQYHNIYITSDVDIKERNWGLSKLNELVRFGKKFHTLLYKKIILTTDQDLIKDGVQSIDDEFLEWFVKNPSCEEVEVISLRKSSGWYDEKEIWYWDFLAYKIIIPKEKPKQIWEQIIEDCGGEEEFMKSAGLLPKQETLEEFIRIESKSANESIGIMKGVEWQSKRSYSEAIDLFITEIKNEFKDDNWDYLDFIKIRVIEQFKKK